MTQWILELILILWAVDLVKVDSVELISRGKIYTVVFIIALTLLQRQSELITRAKNGPGARKE